MILHNKQNIEWKQINFRNVVSLLGAQFILDLYDQYVPNINVFRFRNVIAYYKDGKLWTYTPKKDMDYIIENIKKRFIKLDSKFMDDIKSYTNRRKVEIFALFSKLDMLDIKNISNNDLADLLLEWYYTSLNDIFPMNIAPVEHGLTRALRELLYSKYKHKTDEIISYLLSFNERTMAGHEEYSLLKIALEVKSNEAIRSKLIEEHYEEFHHLPYAYGSVAWDKEYFEKRLNSFLEKSKNEIIEMMDKSNIKIQEDVYKKREILNEINDEKISFLSEIGTILGLLRDKNKAILSKSIKYRNMIINEIETRLAVDTKFLFLDEIVDMLYNDNRLDEIELSKRKNGMVLSSAISYLTDEAAREKISLLARENVERNYFEGICSSPGYVVGKARICNSYKDCSKLKSGEILVTYGTDFDFIDAMMRSSAILAEEGGMLSHASVISRELNKPCIISLTGIVNSIKDNDTIEVNATEGYVRVLHRNMKESDKNVNNYFLRYDQVNKANAVDIGNKAYNIVRIKNMKLNVPNGIIIPSSYFNEVLRRNKIEQRFFDELQKFGLTKETGGILEIIDNLNVDLDDISFFDFTKNTYAVRSSGKNEDSENFTFSGQHHTGLFIDNEEMMKNEIKNCWKSFFSPNVIQYREINKIGFENIIGGILIQEMVLSDFSGVLFSMNPLGSTENEIVIEACYGSCRKIVNGLIKPATYIINREKPSEITAYYNNEFKLEKVQIDNLLQAAFILEKEFNCYVDIEWSYSNNKLYILQCRPITKI